MAYHVTRHAVLAMLLLLALPVSAALLRVAPEIQSVPVGEVFTVDIEWVDGEGWLGGSFLVRFDETMLEYVGYQYGTIGDPQYSGPPVVSPGLLDRLGVASFQGLTDGTALTLSFRLRQSGQTLIDMQAYTDWSNGVDFVLLTPDTADGAVGSDDIGVSRAVYPDSLSIADVRLGDTVEFTVDLTSVGTAPLHVYDVNVPTDQDVYRIGGDGCSRRVLRPGQGCVVHVSAMALQFGSNAYHITNLDFVTSDVIDPGPNTRLVLSNVRPVLDTPRLQFFEGSYTPPFARRTARITNIGDWPADIGDIVFNGNYRDNFFLVANGCSGETLAIGESCEALIEFRPELYREHTAFYNVYYGNGALLEWGLIAGYPPTGLPSVSFGGRDDWTQPIGDSSTRSIVIRNKGSLPLGFTNGSIQSQSGFEVMQNCLGATLQSRESCSITLRPLHAVPGEYEWQGWVRTDSLWRRYVPMAVPITVTAD